MNIYLASSWRNPYYQATLTQLKNSFSEHSIYDFRETNSSFRWGEVSSDWESWTANQYLDALTFPVVSSAFFHDFEALRSADLVILLNPCGISAHIEAAWAKGAGKDVIDYYTFNSSNTAYHHAFHIELMKAVFEHKAVGYSDLHKLIQLLDRF